MPSKRDISAIRYIRHVVYTNVRAHLNKMGNHKKKYTDYSEFRKAGVAMGKYQKIHNIIRKDYMELMNVTEKHKSDKKEFDSLYRACLKGLFSIIEADIFGLNNLDEYENYSDKDSFEKKFKNTFKQVCKTWNKTELQKKYFDGKYRNLKELKKKRDELIHPKEVEHLHEASESEFEILKNVFNDYDIFINSLMDDFFISVDMNSMDILGLNKNVP